MSDEYVVGPVDIQHHVEPSELRLIGIYVDQTTPGETVDHERSDPHLVEVLRPEFLARPCASRPMYEDDRRQAARSASRQPQLAGERDSLSVLVAYQELLIR